MLAGQHAHCRATRQKVLNHLPGHIAGEGRHPPRGQAMVARAHQHLGGVQHRGFGAQDHTQAQRQALQQAQRSQGLGLVVNDVLQAVGQRGIMQVSNGWKYER